MDITHCYELLGLKSGASEEEIKQAYRDLVKVWHPDRFGHDPKLQKKTQEKLKEINEAYQVIQDFLNNPYKYERPTEEAFKSYKTPQPTGKKGSLYGDIFYKQFAMRSLMTPGWPEKFIRVPNTNVSLLRYSESLIKEYKLFRGDYNKKIQDIHLNYKYRSSDLTDSIKDSDLTDLIKDTVIISNEFENKAYELIFPHILKKVTTDNNGHYEFLDVHYGKYFVYYAYRTEPWVMVTQLIPIEINNREQKVDGSNFIKGFILRK